MMENEGDPGKGLDVSRTSDYGAIPTFHDAALTHPEETENVSTPTSQAFNTLPSSVHASDSELDHVYATVESGNALAIKDFPVLQTTSAAILPRWIYRYFPCLRFLPTWSCFPDPTQGPLLSPRRNLEFFRAILYLLDGGRKQQSHFQDDAKSMRFYYLRQTLAYRTCIIVACIMYLSISLTEAPNFQIYSRKREQVSRDTSHGYELTFNVISVLFFVLDIWIQFQAMGKKKTFGYRWTQLFVVLLAFDVVGMAWPQARLLMVTGIVRCYPIVYYSKKARNAMLDYLRTVPSVIQWIGIEFLSVLVFACFAVILYASVDRGGASEQTAFLSLNRAFISLYELSLTVNDPDIYLPYYRIDALNAILFVAFLILTFFLLHNIILASVFRIYSAKLRDTAVRRNSYRESALNLAFRALVGENQGPTGRVHKDLLAHVLKRVFPHHSSEKISAFMQYADREDSNDDDQDYDYDRFLILMSAIADDCLHVIRPSVAYPGRLHSFLDVLVLAELLVAVVAVARYWHIFYKIWLVATLAAFRFIFALDIIYGLLQIKGFKIYLKSSVHKCKLLALLFFLVALVCMLTNDRVLRESKEVNMTQKAASMFLLLSVFADVVRLSTRVPEYAALVQVFRDLLVPALLSQATVIFFLMHLTCYAGMYLFGGRIYPSQPIWATLPFPGSLYYLLNFNTYREGMLTLFMLLVVNNWNQISAQFVRVTHPAAYLFFMAYQVLVVTIALSCVTSFFITHLSNQLGEELEKGRKRKEGKEDKVEGKENQKKKKEGTFSWGGWGSWLSADNRKGSMDELQGANLRSSRSREERGRTKHTLSDLYLRAESSLEPARPPSLSNSSPSGASNPSPTSRPARFRLRRRVSSCYLALRDEQPVADVEYQCLLEALLKEKGQELAYCFIKEQRNKSHLESFNRSTGFARIIRPYPQAESSLLKTCADLFGKDMSKQGKKEGGNSSDLSTPSSEGRRKTEGGNGDEITGKAEEKSETKQIKGAAEGAAAGEEEEVMVEDEEEDADDMGEKRDCVMIQDIMPHPSESCRALYMKIYFMYGGDNKLAFCQLHEQ